SDRCTPSNMMGSLTLRADGTWSLDGGEWPKRATIAVRDSAALTWTDAFDDAIRKARAEAQMAVRTAHNLGVAQTVPLLTAASEDALVASAKIQGEALEILKSVGVDNFAQVRAGIAALTPRFRADPENAALGYALGTLLIAEPTIAAKLKI